MTVKRSNKAGDTRGLHPNTIAALRASESGTYFGGPNINKCSKTGCRCVAWSKSPGGYCYQHSSPSIRAAHERRTIGGQVQRERNRRLNALRLELMDWNPNSEALDLIRVYEARLTRPRMNHLNLHALIREYTEGNMPSDQFRCAVRDLCE